MSKSRRIYKIKQGDKYSLVIQINNWAISLFVFFLLLNTLLILLPEKGWIYMWMIRLPRKDLIINNVTIKVKVTNAKEWQRTMHMEEARKIRGNILAWKSSWNQLRGKWAKNQVKRKSQYVFQQFTCVVLSCVLHNRHT